MEKVTTEQRHPDLSYLLRYSTRSFEQSTASHVYNASSKDFVQPKEKHIPGLFYYTSTPEEKCYKDYDRTTFFGPNFLT